MSLSKKKQYAIALFGVPRSGTSWLGQILNSSPRVAYRYQPLFSYEFKDRLSEESKKDDIERFHHELKSAKSNFVLQTESIGGERNPLFKKDNIDVIVWKEVRYHNIIKNLLEKDRDLKIIGIVRNPKSVISSWYNAPKEFKKDEWDLAKEWREAKLKNEGKPEEFFGYDKWKETTKLFQNLQKKYPSRFYLLDYSDLLNNTRTEVKKLFEFCGIEYTKQTDIFLIDGSEKDRSDDPYSVYRKNQTDDKWKTGLPEEISNEIDKDLKGTSLEQYNR